MGAKSNQEVILETIDSLRRRKARPDLERICHMVERKYGVSAAEVECELERLVDDEVVYKVEYKGSTSYRNASKWKQSHLSGNRLNSTDLSRLLLETVQELAASSRVKSGRGQAGGQGGGGGGGGSGTGQSGGVAIEDIEKHLLTVDPDSKLTSGTRLQNALDREVFSGRLSRVTKGVYAAKVDPSRKRSTQASSTDKKTEPTVQAAKKPDPVKKRKRIRKTHGPDFEHEPLCKQSTYEQRCDYCSFQAGSNKFGDAEELLVCKDCSLKVHPSCMRYSPELAERSRLSPWQCMDCKTCLVCHDSGDADKLLFCDSCDKGYHMACHYPPVYKQPEGKWVCFTCERDEEMAYYSSDGSAVLSSNEDFYSLQSSPGEPSSAPPVNESTKESSSTPGKVSPDVATPSLSNAASLPEQSATSHTNRDFHMTDPVDWGIEDVVRYFQAHGFPEQSLAFQEQEIDGKSLLLMKRLDVLTGLSLKLGPALKIYNHVMRLQLFCKHGGKSKTGKGAPSDSPPSGALLKPTSKASTSSASSATAPKK